MLKGWESQNTLRSAWNKRVSEMMRMTQAYIILRGLRGNTGIQDASYKKVHKDSRLMIGGGSNGRGVIRYDYPGDLFLTRFL